MLLYDIVCFLFLVPLPPVSEITPLKVDQFAWEFAKSSKSAAL